MQSDSVVQRLRRFLLGVAAAIFVGAIAELILVEHTSETQQWLPFIFSGLGLLALAGVWFNPNKATLKTLWWVMAAISLGSLYGVYLHFIGNLAFTREINPSFSLAQSIWPALKGSNPLLAPGVFFLGGILGIAATYRHPMLQNR